jgi:hypothetical protein
MRKTGIAGFIIRDAFLQYPLERVLHPLSLFKAIKQEQGVEGRPSVQALDQQAHQQSSQRSKRAIFLPFHMLFLHIRPQAKRNIMIIA